MSWLDAFFFGYSIQVLGVPFPHENVLNFTGAVVGSDDVANGRTTVNVTGGGGGGGITALTGDVTASGSGSVAATVAGIQGNPVSSTPPIAAQLLLENSGATGSAWTTVSGDSTLSATGAMVNTAVHGATVPAAGSLATGNVLQVSGASALTYGAVNLAGGAGYVTGALPAGNIAPGSSDQLLETNHAGVTAWFSPSGDLTFASNSFSVVSLAGSSGTTVANSSVTQDGQHVYGWDRGEALGQHQRGHLQRLCGLRRYGSSERADGRGAHPRRRWLDGRRYAYHSDSREDADAR